MLATVFLLSSFALAQTPAQPPRQNHPPTVRARCEPCTVYVGQASTVTADASDPDGDPLTYTWRAPAGTITSPSSRSTAWTAPLQEGPVPVTVRVDDGKGGTASDVVTIHVIRQDVREVTLPSGYDNACPTGRRRARRSVI
ncbi:MAG TPA: putative Ig domain-containing protein [Vicinamibacterales bacterium]